MQESIFTKIIKGEIPSHKIFEDDKSLAFLDINPFTAGHTLVIPKVQVDHLWDADDELYEHLMSVAKKVAGRIRSVIDPPRVGILVEGFEVPHAHIHVFPMYEAIRSTLKNQIPKPTDQELAVMAEKLRFQ